MRRKKVNYNTKLIKMENLICEGKVKKCKMAPTVLPEESLIIGKCSAENLQKLITVLGNMKDH